MKAPVLIRRMVAFLIDSIIIYIVFVYLLQTLVFVPLRQLIFGSDAWFLSGWHTQIYTLITISLPSWFYFTLFESSPWQATIGKRLLKLKTVEQLHLSGLGFPRAFLRTIIKLLPWEIAHLSNNLPVPMWYDPNPGFRIGFALVPVLVTVYLLLTFFTKHQQSLHDLILKTLVIQTES